MKQMGLAGPELWKTSTLFTKQTRAGLSNLLSDKRRCRKFKVTGCSVHEENGPNPWSTKLFVSLFLFLRFDK